MPLRHRVLAAWYTQLAQQLEAGISLPDALRRDHGAAATRALSAAMAAQFERGGSVDDALRDAGPWLPRVDQLTLSAAAEIGRMPVLLRNLAARHAQLGATKLRIALACVYPLAILHVGFALFPFLQMIDWEKGFAWSTARYVGSLATTVLPLWAGIAIVTVLARRGSPALRKIASAMPALRGYLRAQALSDLGFAMGNFVEAGVPVSQAWAAAGLISEAPTLKRAAAALAAVAERGEPPGNHLAAWPDFPSDFVARYRTAETTGQLDITLLQLGAEYQDAANRALTLATLLYPALVFLVVGCSVAIGVIHLYAGYLKMVTKLAE